MQKNTGFKRHDIQAYETRFNHFDFTFHTTFRKLIILVSAIVKIIQNYVTRKGGNNVKLLFWDTNLWSWLYLVLKKCGTSHNNSSISICDMTKSLKTRNVSFFSQPLSFHSKRDLYLELTTTVFNIAKN